MHRRHLGTSSCYGAGLSSRPDALLASSPSPPSGYMLHHCSQQPPPLPLAPSHQSDVVAAPGRYNAEERRERIDKYRSKRNHRNFQKKITYACRKTLADSRPRVKGRFARTIGAGDYDDCTEAEAADHVQAPAAAGTHESQLNIIMPAMNPSSDDHHTNVVATMPEWWPPVQEALITDELPTGVDLGHHHLCDDAADDEMLAAYLGVSSISLYSSYSSPSP